MSKFPPFPTQYRLLPLISNYLAQSSSSHLLLGITERAKDRQAPHSQFWSPALIGPDKWEHYREKIQLQPFSPKMKCTQLLRGRQIVNGVRTRNREAQTGFGRAESLEILATKINVCIEHLQTGWKASILATSMWIFTVTAYSPAKDNIKSIFYSATALGLFK